MGLTIRLTFDFRAVWLRWCPGQESNLHDLNRSLGPQPSASTNSATWAILKEQPENLSAFGLQIYQLAASLPNESRLLSGNRIFFPPINQSKPHPRSKPDPAPAPVGLLLLHPRPRTNKKPASVNQTRVFVIPTLCPGKDYLLFTV